MWVLLKLIALAQYSFLILGQGWSLTRSNACVYSCTNVYPLITKILQYLGQGQETSPLNLTTLLGIIIIKQTALLFCAVITLFTLSSLSV